MAGTNNIVSNNWKAKRKLLIKICGAYEINGEPVIFLQYFGDVTPVLYRLRINPSTGALIKEEVVGLRPKKFFMRQANDIGFDQNIYVEKDPESDNYAVIYFNGKEREVGDRIKVMHFDGNHKLLNQADYDSPDANIKFLNLIGAVVDGSKRVYIVTYGAQKEKGSKAHVFIAMLTHGDSTFLNKTLDFTEDFMKTNSDIVYDRKNNRLVMLTNTLAETKSSSTTYVSFLSYIDPENLSLKGVNILSNEKVNEYAHKELNTKLDYTGLPQKLVLNRDNSITVLQEEMTFKEVYSEKSGATLGQYTYMGNIGITEVGTDGVEKNGYVMMKKQFYVGKLNSMYMAGRDKGLWSNDIFSRRSANDDQFMSYEYINTDKGSYVLFNDNPKNDKKGNDQIKRKLAENTDYMNTICYFIKDGGAKRSYLFGEPKGKKYTIACDIEASDYDKKTNIYTTIVSEQHGRKYDSHIAWIHFE